MKLTIGMIILTVFTTTAADLYSQTTKLSLECNNEKIADVLIKIEDQSEFRFFYNEEVILGEEVSIKVENKVVKDVLNLLFKNRPIAYEVVGRQIILKEADKTVIQQEKKVSGVVTSTSDESIPGVTVIIEGTNNGTVTDIDGRYSISNVPEGAKLIFSFVGMEKQVIEVGNQSSINVKLEASSIGIQEVIAIGYGTMKKSDLTGSVASVSADELAAFPVLSAAQALQGRAAGVQITELNGEPGAGSTIRIRGGTSINASSDPLWVVDGFAGAVAPPPEDIESIEILKDASSTAIYGSRGANGVILVTTKSGTKGKTRIELNTSYRFDKPSKMLDLLNATEYAEYINEARTNDNSASIPYDNPSSYGEGTDWQDVVYRGGSLQNYQLSAAGGKESFRFYTSANYFGQKGIVINSDYKRYSGLSNIDFQAGENVKIGTNMFFRRTEQNGVRSQEIYGGYTGVTTSATTFEPTLGIYDEDGVYSRPEIKDPADNPYANAMENTNESVNDLFQGSAYVDWKIMNDLTFRSSYGVSIKNNRTGTYIPTSLVQGETVGGRGSITTSRGTNILNENYLSYDKKIDDRNKVSLMGGFSYQSSKSEYATAINQTFITDAFSFYNLGGGSDYQIAYSGLTEWSILSYYVRANYNYNDKYLLTFTGRYDGSSRFGKNNKWGFFPSGAFAWNVKQEPFMQSFENLSHLKLRVSYGETGNTDIGSYQSLANFEALSAVVNNETVNAVRPQSVANSDLSWESTKQTDIGLDFGLWNERVIVTADYYYMKTEDLLYDVPLVEYSGYTSVLKNIGNVENNGFEFGLNTVNIEGKLRWTTDFNISMNRNKVTSLNEGEEKYGMAIGSFNMGVTNILTEGEPMGSFYGYEFDGIDDTDGSVVYRDIAGRDEENNLIMEPDGVINSDDRTIIGNPHPDFIFGFTNTLNYKNFDLNIFIQGVTGNDMYNFTRMELETASGRSNQLATVLDRWTPSNTDGNIPKATSSNNYISSSRWVEDGSYIRLKNLSLGYSLPKSILGKSGIEKLRIYVSGQNLFTLTDYTGYNPDVSYRSGNKSIGLDYGTYPTTRSITLGLNISF